MLGESSLGVVSMTIATGCPRPNPSVTI
ncbi:MAG: hypothetical protein IPP47_33820 [Bryobacterales bacterium]|nr:hypothetical protein [Bryobacterales bacterium]